MGVPKRVLITARSFGKVSAEPAALLEHDGCELIWHPGPLKEDELIPLVKDVAGMIVGADEVTARVLQNAPCLKVVCQHGVGVDGIDLAAARRQGVVVANIPGANADAVADLTWALILGLAREVPAANDAVKKGDFPVFMGHSVNGKHLGIIGMGSIGKAVARRAFGFGMTVSAYDPRQDAAFAKQWNVRYLGLEPLLRESDFVTIHLPLTKDTANLLDKQRLSLLKPGAYLVNMSRGGIVDESALVELLRQNHLSGVATDVFSSEPPGKDHLLVSAAGNVITTPHMGGRTIEALTCLSLSAAQTVVNVLNGTLDGVNVVNR